MLLPSRVAGRTLGLRGPDLARGPEVARLCTRPCLHVSTHSTMSKSCQFFGTNHDKILTAFMELYLLVAYRIKQFPA